MLGYIGEELNSKSRYIDKDPSFEKELMYFKKEISSIIFTLIHEWKNNYSEETFVIADGERKSKVKSFKDDENLKYLNVIMRDFLDASKCEEIINLNYYKGNTNKLLG